jgi:hypothetical protein
MKLNFSHPLVLGLIQARHLSLWPTSKSNGDSFFHYSHGGEQITSHDAIWDVLPFIVKDVRFHVSHEQIHIFPLFFI